MDTAGWCPIGQISSCPELELNWRLLGKKRAARVGWGRDWLLAVCSIRWQVEGARKLAQESATQA